MGWQVWRTIAPDHSRWYCNADSKAHAERLAKYHSSISIHPYHAKEVPDAPSVPTTAGRAAEEGTARDETAAESVGGRGHLEVSLSQRYGVGTIDVGRQGDEAEREAESLPVKDDEPILVIDMQSRPNPEDARSIRLEGEDADPDVFEEDARTEEEKINEGYYTYARPMPSNDIAGMTSNDPLDPYARPTSPVDVAHHVDTSLSHIYGNASPAGADAASLPYTAGSRTSKDASEDAAHRASNQRMRIWTFLRANPNGLTFEEIADGIGMYNNSVSTRLTQMRDAGMIDFVEIEVTEPNWEAHTDIETRVTKQGSQAAVFQALPEPWIPKPRRIRGRLSRYCLALKEIEALADVTSFPPMCAAVVEAIYNIAREALGET